MRFTSRRQLFFSVVLSLSIVVPEHAAAKDWTSDPVTWWPDPATGLMWTGQLHAKKGLLNKGAMGYDEAAQYCTNLKLGGFTGWRLPTLDEVKAASQVMRRGGTSQSMFVPALIQPIPPDMPWDLLSRPMALLYFAYYPKGTVLIWTMNEWIWTSTPSPAGPKTDPVNWVETFAYDKGNSTGEPADPTWNWKKAWAGPQVVCTRPMEPELAQVAAEAGPVVPIPDVETLKKYIPFNKARLAYQAGNFQETIDDAKQALQGLPKMYRAYWAMGIAYGRLGEWDEAIANLKTASATARKQTREEDAIILESLHWANQGKKAAAKGQTPKDKTPDWFPYPVVPVSTKTFISVEQQ
ncbi:MAG: tetratricopeptide repeat protein [Terracidiphilus sp.]